MSTPVNAGDLIEVKLGTYCQGQAGINVRHYLVLPGATPGVELEDVALLLDNTFHSAYKTLLAADATWYGVQVQIISPGLPSNAEFSATHVGTGAVINTQALPTQVSGIITLNTGVAGRKFRGRTYVAFPGRNDADLALGTPTAGYVSRLGPLGDLLDDQFNIVAGGGDITIIPVLTHTDGTLPTAIEGNRPRQKWATQRSRGNYGAKNPYPPF